MRLSRLVPAAAAALIALPALAGGPPLPRTYTAEDCQDLDAQLADTMRNSNLDQAILAPIQQRQASAERACNSGQYAAGARQLRDLIDEVIASRH